MSGKSGLHGFAACVTVVRRVFYSRTYLRTQRRLAGYGVRSNMKSGVAVKNLILTSVNVTCLT